MFRRPQQRCPFTTVGFRLMLMVSLWQGPIIWGHDHAPVNARLAEHVARFHAGESDAWNLGWHWHVSMPDSRMPNSPEDSGPHRDPLEVATVFRLVSALGKVGSWGFTHPASPLLSNLFPPVVLKPSLGVHDSCLHSFRCNRLTQHLLCRMSC